MKGSGPRLKIKTLQQQDETLRKIEYQAARHDKKRAKRKTEADLMMECILTDLVSKKGGYWLAEFAFYPGRKFRFDYAVHGSLIGIEIEGAVWTSGRHTRGAGYVADMEKYNLAALQGWRVFRFTPSQVLRGTAAATLRLVL
jgi:hypothetical protein